MYPRALGPEIIEALKRFPVVALLGPRQCGKTTLAKALQRSVRKPTVYLDLELPSDRSKLADPELFLRSLRNRLVILDEIQRVPDLFPLLRALIDEHRHPGRYLILGSASGDLLRQSSETLAGRIEHFELTPFFLAELASAAGTPAPAETLWRLWVRGGYPTSYLAPSLEESRRWRRAFITTYLERDVPQLGIGIPAAQLRRFWEMLAHLSGQLWNASHVASSLGVSAPTARRYFDVLTSTFVSRQLQPYHPLSPRRLVKAPKVYLRDSGILHELLRAGSLEDLLGHPAAGPSWEGFVIEQTLPLLPRDWVAYFYRAHSGAEIDLLLSPPSAEPVGVEIKLSTSPTVTAGTLRALEDCKCKRAYVVVPPRGSEADEPYPLRENLTVIPLTAWIVEVQRLTAAKRRPEV
jgi:predicted AAA+ superfamily ATPase